MAGNPNISQGTLNRLRGSIIIPTFPELNVTASFLNKDGISLRFDGNATVMIDSMTGRVTSPVPYLAATIEIHLLKSQSLAALFKKQMEADSRIGDVTFRSDSAVLPPYQIANCAIESVPNISANGESADYPVTIAGTYFINNDLWNL